MSFDIDQARRLAHSNQDVGKLARRLEDACDALQSTQEQYQAAREALEEIRNATSAAGSGEMSVMWVAERARRGLGESSPASEPHGYIELDDQHNCSHGIHKGLGCIVCDPAVRTSG